MYVDVIPRSILITKFDDTARLMIGLGEKILVNFPCLSYFPFQSGDGTVIAYNLDPSKGKLSDGKKHTIGTQQIQLFQATTNGSSIVFACSDHPVVIHSDHDKLRFETVNMRVSLRNLPLILTTLTKTE